jgi:hypothetical protein
LASILETKLKTRSPVVKRLTTSSGRSGRSEQGVESLEAESRPVGMSPAFHDDGERVVLFVDAFYRGVRRMLVKMTADEPRMDAAARFLASRD